MRNLAATKVQAQGNKPVPVVAAAHARSPDPIRTSGGQREEKCANTRDARQ